MTTDESREDQSTAPHDPDRLHGWKEIASFLDRGVRTAQRWEKNYGLPVKRIGNDGGEIVFASRREVAAWMESEGSRRAAQEPTSPEPPVPDDRGPQPPAVEPPPAPALSPRWVVALVGTAMLAFVAWLGLGSASTPARGTIASVSNEAQDLVARDDGGRVLWRFATGLDLQMVIQKWTPGEVGADHALVDVDADGRQEVIVAGRSSSRRDGAAFFLLNDDGTLRRAIRPGTSVRVGETTFGAPWVPHHVHVVLSEDRRTRMFLSFIDARLFPTLLLEVDSEGEVVSEYFSNGYVNSVVELPWNGERILAIGAANNEHLGGSLAVFRNRPATGSAPATTDAYRCLNCEGGHPDVFLVFPARCFNQVYDRSSLVRSLQLSGPGQLSLEVLEGDPGESTGVTYVMDRDLVPVRAEATSGLVEVHARWFREGRIDHPLSADRDGKDLFPVLAWSSGRFVALPTAPIVW